jgi:hypothetical protein
MALILLGAALAGCPQTKKPEHEAAPGAETCKTWKGGGADDFALKRTWDEGRKECYLEGKVNNVGSMDGTSLRVVETLVHEGAAIPRKDRTVTFLFEGVGHKGFITCDHVTMDADDRQLMFNADRVKGSGDDVLTVLMVHLNLAEVRVLGAAKVLRFTLCDQPVFEPAKEVRDLLARVIPEMD